MQLSENAIHLWVCHPAAITDQAVLQQYHRILNPQEAEQQQKFYFPKDQHQYLVTRALLRHVLSLYQPDIQPAEWMFYQNKYGKPFIQNALGDRPLFFNVSHTDNYIVLAIAMQPLLGVDVEYIERDAKYIELSSRYFAANEKRWLQSMSVAQQRHAFFALWTLKEAYIKGQGKGLILPLQDFSFVDDHGHYPVFQVVRAHSDTDTFWKFWQFTVEDNYQLALAMGSPAAHDTYVITSHDIVPASNYETINLPLVGKF